MSPAIPTTGTIPVSRASWDERENRPQTLSLRAGTLWGVAGSVFQAICQWAILSAIAKIGTAEMVGQFALGLAMSAPVFILAQMNLRAVQATDARHEFSFGQYLRLRIVMVGVALIVVVILASLTGYRADTKAIICIIALSKAIESMSDIVHGLCQQRERLDLVAYAVFGRGLGNLFLVVSVLLLTKSIVAATIAMMVWWLIWFLTYERGLVGQILGKVLERRPPVPGPGWLGLWRLAKTSLPLGIAATLISLNSNVPRYFVQHYLGEEALGYFAAMAYIAIAGTVSVDAIGQAAAPSLARLYLRERRDYIQLTFKLVGLVACLGFTALVIVRVAGGDLLAFLYRPEYARYSSVFVWIVAAGALRGVACILGFALTAARSLKSQVSIQVVALACNAALCWLLIPNWGLQGSAFAVLGAALIASLGAGVVSFPIAARRAKDNLGPLVMCGGRALPRSMCD